MIALITLAYLQYHWLGSVSEGERTRLEESLQASSENFATDFDRVFRNLSSHFRIQTFDNSQGLNEVLTESYAKWKLNTGYPGLLDSLYLVLNADNEDAQVQVFNSSSNALEEAQSAVEIKTWISETDGIDDLTKHSFRFDSKPHLGNPTFITVPVRRYSLMPSIKNVTVKNLENNGGGTLSLSIEDTSDLIVLKLNDAIIKDELYLN